MILTIDIGNTNILLGCFKGNELVFRERISSKREATDLEYAAMIKTALDMYTLTPQQIDGAIMASVVPTITNTLKRAIEKLIGIETLVVGPGIKSGLSIRIDNPAQLGADLVAGAVGALEEYTMPCVIIDMGTASTVSVLDRNGTFLGGVIAAGVRLTLKALTANTSQLPSIPIEAPSSVIGTNTVECMQSGLVYGTAAMIDGLLDQIEEELGETPTFVATGGLSKEIIAHCKKNIIYSENLLLEGLKAIYEKNN